MHHATMPDPNQEQQAEDVLLPVPQEKAPLQAPEIRSTGGSRQKREATPEVPGLEEGKKSIEVKLKPMKRHADLEEKPMHQKPKVKMGLSYKELLKQAKKKWPMTYEGY